MGEGRGGCCLEWGEQASCRSFHPGPRTTQPGAWGRESSAAVHSTRSTNHTRVSQDPTTPSGPHLPTRNPSLIPARGVAPPVSAKAGVSKSPVHPSLTSQFQPRVLGGRKGVLYKHCKHRTHGLEFRFLGTPFGSFFGPQQSNREHKAVHSFPIRLELKGGIQ